MRRIKVNARQWLFALVSAALLSFGGGTSASAAGISNTDHDLRSIATGTTELCIFCHTPHTTSALSPEAPLWNRNIPSGTFNMYDSTVSPTIDMTVATQPQGVSLGCLSCHDGATAFNSLIRTAGQTITTTPATMSGGAALGLNLTNDHPISVTYDTAQDPDFKTLASVQSSTLVRLFGASNNQVECASCHDPHDDTNMPFLRAPNTNSQLCFVCHDK